MEESYEYIDNILKNNEMTYLQYLKEDCKDEVILKEINDIISVKTFIKKHKQNNEQNNFKQNEIEEYLYKRPWNKLHKIQKKNRLMIYLNEYLLQTDNLEEIKLEILNDFEKGKLNSAKNVFYDSLASKILNINKLKYDKEKNLYIY